MDLDAEGTPCETTSMSNVTGIRRSPSTSDAWQAIVNGKLKVEIYGRGARKLAIAAAGTDKEIEDA